MASITANENIFNNGVYTPLFNEFGVTINDCSLNIINGKGTPLKFAWHPDYGVLGELESGSHYSLQLKYNQAKVAYAEIKIDGKNLKIKPVLENQKTYKLDCDETRDDSGNEVNKKLTFYSTTSAPINSGIKIGKEENGLIEVKFYRDVEYLQPNIASKHEIQKVVEKNKEGKILLHVKTLTGKTITIQVKSLHETIRTLRILLLAKEGFGLQCCRLVVNGATIPTSSKKISDWNITTDTKIYLYNPLSGGGQEYTEGATTLQGKSNQTFRTVNVDYPKEPPISIMLRLYACGESSKKIFEQCTPLGMSNMYPKKMPLPSAPLAKDIPDAFKCPLSLDIMKDPVQCSDGHTYERSQIAKWLSDRNTSPLTGKTLKTKELVPNYAIKKAIDEFINSK